MRKILLLGAVLAISGCTASPEQAPETGSEAQPDTETAASAPAATGDGLPVEQTAEVTDWETCPYLDDQWLAEANGQRVTQVGIDKRFSTPACVYWSYPEDPQATIIVRDMPSVEDARAAVDWAAPIDATELAEQGEWSGGRGVIDGHAVYAVAKDTHAVLVWSNQEQTVKSETIATEVIANLGL